MSPEAAAVEAPLNSADVTKRLSQEDLLAPFIEALTPRGRWRVGTEAEKFGVFTDTWEPIPYTGERGILAVLGRLVRDYGWSEKREYEGGDVIALVRAGASITLEPGAQLELSGAPFASVHETASELQQHLRELSTISEDLGINWLGVGFHPLATQAQLPWVPKLRYRIMREYLPTRGSGGLDMMRRTCTVQANFDYASEDDAVEKLRVALALSPIVTAMFANSPLREGHLTGRVSERAATWNHMDPDRSGLLPFVFEDGMGFERYVQWALDVPMFMVKRGSQVLTNTGQTFREFMRDGFAGTWPDADDWVSHLASLFPEVRLKKTLEVRGADAQSSALQLALPALWKGLLYDDVARAGAVALASRLPVDALQAAREEIASQGLRARLAGRPVGEWAAEVLTLAQEGLHRANVRDDSGRDEAIYLEPMATLLAAGQCPADRLIHQLGPAPTATEIAAMTALTPQG